MKPMERARLGGQVMRSSQTAIGLASSPIDRLGRRPALDGVRACAIAAVMGLHTVDRFFSGGGLGVDIFFVLSAFLITSLVLEESEDRQGHFGYVAFYRRRAFRLGPALILWLVLVAAPTSVAIHQVREVPLSTLASIFYLGDLAVAWTRWVGDAYTHVWSLAIEEQFYLLWPVLLVSFVRRIRRRRRALLISGLALAIVVELLADRWVPNAYFLPVGHVVPIAAGCLAAEFFTFGLPRGVRYLVTTQWVSWVVVAATAVYVVGLRGLHLAQVPWLPMLLSIGMGIFLLYLVRNEGGILTRILSLPPVIWIGQRSYGLYLYHRTLAILIPAIIPGITLGLAGALTLVAALGLAATSFSLVERPMLRVGGTHFGRP